jgi:hypothetical protein
MHTLFLADAPTYAALIAAYPENGAALAALPAGTRVYVEDMQCEVRRSANGKFWLPAHPVTGPVPISPANQVALYGPAGATTLSTSTNQTRTLVRPTYYRMPGNRPAVLKGFQVYLATAGVVGGTTSGFDVRLYLCNPDGSPRVGEAPLYVWSYNAAGSGTGAIGIGTGTPGAADFTAGAGTWFELALPGGNRDVPPQFWLATRHDYTTTPPALTVTNQNSYLQDMMPFITPSDGTSTINRGQGYSWSEGAFTLGEFAVFSASAEMALTASHAHCVLVDVVA